MPPQHTTPSVCTYIIAAYNIIEKGPQCGKKQQIGLKPKPAARTAKSNVDKRTHRTARVVSSSSPVRAAAVARHKKLTRRKACFILVHTYTQSLSLSRTAGIAGCVCECVRVLVSGEKRAGAPPRTMRMCVHSMEKLLCYSTIAL